MENLEQFEQLVTWFKESKYADHVKVHDEESEIYKFCTVNTDKLIIGFCNKHDEDDAKGRSSYIYINGRLCVEHRDLFDKWRNCITPPIFLPRIKSEFDALIKLIEYIESDQYLHDADADNTTDEELDEILNKIYKDVEHLLDYNL